MLSIYYITANNTNVMKKRSEVRQTLRTGCSKADPQTNTQTRAITIHCTV